MMLKKVYRLLPESLRPVAEFVYKYRTGPSAGWDSFCDARDLLGKRDIRDPVIVDAGAYVGNVTELFLEQYPGATVHAIELLPAHVRRLETRFGDRERVRIHDVAVGDSTGTVTMNIPEKSNTASSYRPSETKFNIREATNNDAVYRVEETIEVEQTRIDELVDHADLIKLDLQGGELDALRGVDWLDSVSVILTETMFQPLYRNQPMFCELDEFLTENGFDLFNLYNLTPDDTGQLSQVDALYINDSFTNSANVLKESYRID
jgi:FkbM family methyltransferase